MVRELFRGALVEWYGANRRDLPWRRRQGDPYAVWVSEVMLQQTQVATALPYYERWMERFPSVRALAEADEQEVLRHWAGLGYYARARNLHRSARYVLEHFEGRLPSDSDALRSVPGIGPYSAGAILAIAYDQPAAIVDGNVARVLARTFALADDIVSTAGKQRLWDLAERLVPASGARDYSQALMELGALVCTPRGPRCAECPMKPGCRAGASDDPTQWPKRAPRRATVRQVHGAAVIARDGRVLLGRRPGAGRWGGLWELPTAVCAEGESAEEAAVRAALELVGLTVDAAEVLGSVRHTVTHHRIELRALAVDAPHGEPEPRGYEELRWATADEVSHLAMAAPQAKLVTAIGRRAAAG